MLFRSNSSQNPGKIATRTIDTRKSPQVPTPADEPDAGLVFDEEVDIAGDKRLIKIKIPFERMGLDAKPIYKPQFVDNIFFYASLALGITITIFTFIWGLVI